MKTPKFKSGESVSYNGETTFRHKVTVIEIKDLKYQIRHESGEITSISILYLDTYYELSKIIESPLYKVLYES